MNNPLSTILATVALCLLAPAGSSAQSYSSLWKQYAQAEKNDKPRTMLGIIGKIEQKAENEKEYGHMIKAQASRLHVMEALSPDSLSPQVRRLEEMTAGSKDFGAKAIRHALLYRIYTERPHISDSSAALAARHAAAAMEKPERLAAIKSGTYDPFVKKGYNSGIFYNDLLSVIGFETKQFAKLSAFYASKGMREAACIAALNDISQRSDRHPADRKKSVVIAGLDSLLKHYADLPVAGEVACELYNRLERCGNVKVEDKISFVRMALAKWGGWQRMGELRNAEKSMTAPSFMAMMPSRSILPEKEAMLTLSNIRNVNSISMRVFATKLHGDTDLNPTDPADLRKIRQDAGEIAAARRTIATTGSPDYLLTTDSIAISPLPVGVYLVELASQPETQTARFLLNVSDVYTLTMPMPDGKTRFVVVSATTGQPIPGAKIRISRKGGRYAAGDAATQTLTCNAKGEATLAADRHAYIGHFAYTAKDMAALPGRTYSGSAYSDNSGDEKTTYVYTDRKIYRPGQTIKVAAVAFVSDRELNYRPLAATTMKAVLRDANYKTVAEKDVATDAYGTCHTDFVIPKGLLNGSFSVSIDNSTAYVRVEEYKRPTFKVEYPTVNEKYENGDTLLIKAKAATYAGLPVQGARVSYKVTRRPAFWWACSPMYTRNPRGHMGETVVYESTATTDSEGAFVTELPLTMPEEAAAGHCFYNFVVEADVTDGAGETQQGTISVPLGTKNIMLDCDLPQKAVKDSLKTITFRLSNSTGAAIKAKVRYRLTDSDAWTEGMTGEQLPIGRLPESGRQRLTAISEGDTITVDYIAFGIDDTEPLKGIEDWFYVSATQFPDDGRPVTIQAGTSAGNVYLVYSVLAGDKVIAEGAEKKNNELENRKLTYDKSYGNGLRICYAWVKDGKLHKHSATIKRPVPDKRLNLKWKTFRDRLTPGQSEKWVLTITGSDGKPAAAQLMATLYDKSLDQLAPHAWTFSTDRWLPLAHNDWQAASGMTVNRWAEESWKPFVFKTFRPALFDFNTFHNIFYCVEELNVRGTARPAIMKKMAMDAAGRAVTTENAEAEMKTAANAAPHDGSHGDRTEAGIQLRENLNETAFFFPALESDTTGSVTMEFTLPESLTTWRFMGLAHTKDICHGMIESEAVAAKQLMVQPNMPRFVRSGDKATVTARIANTADSDIEAAVTMTITDPESGRTLAEETRLVRTKAGETANVTFALEADGTLPLLVCRITASSDRFSDGEQHYLPVLPDKERQTVTVPFAQKGEGRKTIDLTQWPLNGPQGRLTVEYTANPAWLAVQTLSATATPQTDNAIDLAQAIYSNTLAAKIAGDTPGMKAMLRMWAESDANRSRLQLNNELKDIALSETPWTAEADSETEQMQQLHELLDENIIAGRTAAAAAKLKKLQNADGSWSWWPGMRGSQMITLDVAETMARLAAMTGTALPETEAMLAKALDYLDKRLAEAAENARKHNAGTPDRTALRIIYIKTLAGKAFSGKAKAAADFFIGQLKSHHGKLDIYDKALAATVLERTGEKETARTVAESIREHTVADEEKGRYYDTRKAPYSWRDYRIPTQVAAMEALRTVCPDDSRTIDEMRQWLLQAKRTQMWDTPVNNVNAVYALLDGNMKLLGGTTPATIAIDGKAIAADTKTAGMGYVKATVGKPEGEALTFDRKGDGMAWGAVYAQFFAKASNAAYQGKDISIKREIIGAEKTLAVGQKVKVRITIEAKRDLDFVMVSDKRAACMEPAEQISGYRNGAYRTPKDNMTNYYFDMLPKGKHTIETEYYIDRAGEYESGTCTVQCAYAPEYRATAKSKRLTVK